MNILYKPKDEELYKIKAISGLDEKTIVRGYYCRNKDDWCLITEDAEEYVEILDGTVCRNTGAKDKDGTYIYENDLCDTSCFTGNGMGIIVFSETSERYMIQSNINFGGKRELNSTAIKVIGNIVLCDEDMKKFQAYSDKEDAKYTGEPIRPASTPTSERHAKACHKEAMRGIGQ